MADRFMLEYAPKNSKRTQMHYKTTLGHSLPFFGSMKLTSITPKKIVEYRTLRYSKGIKPGTFNLERAMFSTMFNLAIRQWEWVKDNHHSEVKKREAKNRSLDKCCNGYSGRESTDKKLKNKFGIYKYCG